MFPGQGSQVVGMGVGLVEASPAAAELFERASAILGYDLLELVRNGPDERLRETRYSQPAIYVTNYALAVASSTLDACVTSAGHSFGEYCSLTIAGALTFETALTLVKERALAMHAAAELAPGGMSAILGLDVDGVRAAVEEGKSAGRVQMANFNAPGQIVVSGDLAAVKRVVPLNVSGAWHSELMRPARARFAPFVERAVIEQPRFIVVSNVDAQPYRDVAHIRRNLVESLTAEVLWHDTSLRLLAENLDALVEFGASPVLLPLARRLPNPPRLLQAGDVAALERMRDALTDPSAPGRSPARTRSSPVRAAGSARRSRSRLRATVPTSRSSRARRPTWRKPPPSAAPRAQRRACCPSSPAHPTSKPSTPPSGRRSRNSGASTARSRTRGEPRTPSSCGHTRGTSTRCWTRTSSRRFIWSPPSRGP
jgi:[acyl-carrier-protein] S-malonyltransferase